MGLPTPTLEPKSAEHPETLGFAGPSRRRISQALADTRGFYGQSLRSVRPDGKGVQRLVTR